MNPAANIDLYERQREFKPWPDWMVRALKSAEPELQAACELILGTGQRPNAAIQMEFSAFDGDWMTLTDEKSADTFEVYCPDRLRAFITGRPKRGRFVIAKNLAEPLGYNAIEHRFRSWRGALGDKAKEFTLHGLRKLAIVQLAEAGCTDAEIQAVTNQSMEMIADYRRLADRKTLSRNAQKRRNQ